MYQLDLNRELKKFYSGKSEPEIVVVPPIKYIYSDSELQLYSVVENLKLMHKAMGNDFKIMSLEKVNNTYMLAVPDFITKETLEEAKESFKKQKGLKQLNNIDLKIIDEGLSVKLTESRLKESDAINKVMDFINKKSLKPKGDLRYIYLSDKKILLRQPIY